MDPSGNGVKREKTWPGSRVGWSGAERGKMWNGFTAGMEWEENCRKGTKPGLDPFGEGIAAAILPKGVKPGLEPHWDSSGSKTGPGSRKTRSGFSREWKGM